MSILNLNLALVGNNQSIGNDILRALLPDITAYFNNMYQKMISQIPPLIIESIKTQPEYASLMGGTLQGEFGLPDAASRLSSILSSIESGASVVSKPLSIGSNSIKGSIRLEMISKDFSDLLSMGEASFVTEKGTSLPWLQWLLVEGDTVIVGDYSFKAGPNPNSRTGLGIMESAPNAFWRVPPEFAGTINNNWITRAITSASSSIEKTLQQIIQGI